MQHASVLMELPQDMYTSGSDLGLQPGECQGWQNYGRGATQSSLFGLAQSTNANGSGVQGLTQLSQASHESESRGSAALTTLQRCKSAYQHARSSESAEMQPFVHRAPSKFAYHAVHKKGNHRPAMEDTFALHPQLCQLNLCGKNYSNIFTSRLKEQWSQQRVLVVNDQSLTDSVKSSPPRLDGMEMEVDCLNYFAVFDGHKGTSAAEFCSRKLHENLKLRLADLCNVQLTEQPSFADQLNPDDSQSQIDDQAISTQCDNLRQQCNIGSSTSVGTSEVRSLQESSQTHVGRHLLQKQGSFAGYRSLSENDGAKVREQQDFNQLVERAISAAFVDTQKQFEQDIQDSQVGTTAIVALVGEHQLYVGNVGDSRAVLCRNHVALPLSDDQKAERDDERQRIQDADGFVFYFGGALRVFGKIAMTRAIGDTELQPYIIPEPEVTIVNRTDQDQFLILATDGLWDVMDNQEACSYVLSIIQKTRERDPAINRKQQIKCATRMLVDKALKANTKDNVTAVIVDLDIQYKLR